MRVARTLQISLSEQDVFCGALVLVNKDNPLRRDVPKHSLIKLSRGIWLEKQAAVMYEALVKQLHAEACLVPVSGYRSAWEQEKLYATARKEHGAQYTNTYVALPGCSEHQTGLALDVAKKQEVIDYITPSFPYEGICQEFREKAVTYGFVQRYPQGKEGITGIGHETWHFRYVGFPHSQVMAQKGFVLEEYLRWIKGFRWGQNPCSYTAKGRAFAIGYIPAGAGATTIALENEPYSLSGNNQDGFVLTVWRGVP